MKKELEIDAELVRGSGGIFNVTAGSSLLFSKHDEGRFPSESEIIEKLRARLAAK